jgi:nucleotide-binding universal stress UspA family protein
MNEARKATEAVGFRRVLVVTDGSDEGRAATRYAADLSGQFGGTVATVTVTEAKARQRSGQLDGQLAAPAVAADPATAGQVAASRVICTVSGPTVGARNHTLAQEVAEAAAGFGADVIVLGLSRARLARHRLAPSLRSLVAQATEAPVLLAPVVWGQETKTEAGRVPAIDPLSAERTALVRRGRYAGV